MVFYFLFQAGNIWDTQHDIVHVHYIYTLYTFMYIICQCRRTPRKWGVSIECYLDTIFNINPRQPDRILLMYGTNNDTIRIATTIS